MVARPQRKTWRTEFLLSLCSIIFEMVAQIGRLETWPGLAWWPGRNARLGTSVPGAKTVAHLRPRPPAPKPPHTCDHYHTPGAETTAHPWPRSPAPKPPHTCGHYPRRRNHRTPASTIPGAETTAHLWPLPRAPKPQHTCNHYPRRRNHRTPRLYKLVCLQVCKFTRWGGAFNCVCWYTFLVTPRLLASMSAIACNWTSQSDVAHRNDSLMNSYRNAEAQVPNCIRLSATIRLNMDDLKKTNSQLTDEQALRRSILDCNQHKDVAVNPKWSLSDDHERTIFKMLFRISRPVYNAIEEHLHDNKWTESAFTARLLRKARWLLGAVSRCCGTNKDAVWYKIGLVDEPAQLLFITRVLQDFKLNNKGRMSGHVRMSEDNWDKEVDRACVFHWSKSQAEGATSKDNQAEFDKLAEHNFSLFLEGRPLHVYCQRVSCCSPHTCPHVVIVTFCFQAYASAAKPFQQAARALRL